MDIVARMAPNSELHDEIESFRNGPDRIENYRGLSLDAKLCVIYEEIRAFRRDVAEMEKAAKEMASPDKMMEMVQNFIGG